MSIFPNHFISNLNSNGMTFGNNALPNNTTGTIDLKSSNPAFPITINGKIPVGADGEILTGDIPPGGVIGSLGTIITSSATWQVGDTANLISTGFGVNATITVTAVAGGSISTLTLTNPGINYTASEALTLVYTGARPGPPPVANTTVATIFGFPDNTGEGYTVRDYPIAGGTGGVLKVLFVDSNGSIRGSIIKTGGFGYTVSSQNIGAVGVDGVISVAKFDIASVSGGGGGGGGVLLSNTSPWTGKQPFSAGSIASFTNPQELAGDTAYETALGVRPHFKNLSLNNKDPTLPAPITYITNTGLTSFGRCPIRRFNIASESDSFNADTTLYVITDNYISFTRRELFEPRTNTKGAPFYEVTMRAVVGCTDGASLTAGFTAGDKILQIPTIYPMLKLGDPETYEFIAVGTQNETGSSAVHPPVSMIISHTGAFTIRDDLPNRGSDTSVSVAIEFSWNTAPHGAGLQVIALNDFVSTDV